MQKPQQPTYRQPKYAKKAHYSYQISHIPEQNGNKLFIYYKRYVPKGKLQNLIESQDSLYEAFEAMKSENRSEIKEVTDLDKVLPIARTLYVVNFDHEFREQDLKKWFQLIGKVRKIQIGSYKNKNKQKKVQNVYFGLIVFKNEFDMIKVFEEEHLQNKWNEFFKFAKLKQKNDDKGVYLQTLLNTYETQNLDPVKQQKIQQLQDEGFEIVTDHYGQINFGDEQQEDEQQQQDYEDDEEVELEEGEDTIKRLMQEYKDEDDEQEEQQQEKLQVQKEDGQKKKKHILPTFKNDFYKFQTNKTALEDIYGKDDSELDDKQLQKKKKQQLLDSFQQDRLKLQFQKQKKLKKSEN